MVAKANKLIQNFKYLIKTKIVILLVKLKTWIMLLMNQKLLEKDN
jgi:16S rRNA A1518/A1519 N6-dimethyltransferase RsmA/KsgA/DIM1 with predicted DNA glycosylase/AP lyase activity